jgi:transcriptional regulator of acetoin/glycerol metabolism
MSTLLIKNARLLVTMDAERREIADGAVFVRGHVIEAVGGNKTRAAEVMGIDRRTLYRMAERFGIELKE